MFHKAINFELKEGTVLEVTFQSGEVKSYDMSVLFKKYPQLEALKNREPFLEGKLMGFYGIVWDDKLDIEVETIHEDGKTLRKESAPVRLVAANALLAARAKVGISQSKLSAQTGID